MGMPASQSQSKFGLVVLLAVVMILVVAHTGSRLGEVSAPIPPAPASTARRVPRPLPAARGPASNLQAPAPPKTPTSLEKPAVSAALPERLKPPGKAPEQVPDDGPLAGLDDDPPAGQAAKAAREDRPGGEKDDPLLPPVKRVGDDDRREQNGDKVVSGGKKATLDVEDDDSYKERMSLLQPHLVKDREALEISSCAREHALFDNEGKPCRDLKAHIYDQRICASTLKGARYMTCVPPKNGSTYHKGLIFRILGHPDFYKIGAVHNDEEYRSKMKLENFTNEDIAAYFADKDIPKYAIVRNPMIRTLSGYINSVENEDVWEERNLHNMTHAFQQWIDDRFPKGHSRLINRRKQNPHVRSQFEYCGYRHNDFYKQWKIFKFEEPEKYVKYIYEIVPRKYLDDGWGDYRNTSFSDFVLGPRSRSHNPHEKFAEYIGSMKYFDQLERAVRDETEFFGYQKEVARLRAEVEMALG